MTKEEKKALEEHYFQECGDRDVAEEMAQMDYDYEQAAADYYPHNEPETYWGL